MPVGEWLRGPLKGWAEDLLSHDRLKREGYFDAGRIGQLWQDHKLRRLDAGLALWAILMFQAWADNDLLSAPTVWLDQNGERTVGS